MKPTAARRLTQTDRAVRRRVDEIAGVDTGTPAEVARTLWRTAQDAEWQDRDAAGKAARVLAGITGDAYRTKKATAEALRRVRALVASYQEWQHIKDAYRRYVDELEEDPR